MKKAYLLPSALGLGAGIFTGELYRYVFCRGSSPLLAPFLDSYGHKADYYLHREGSADELRALPREEVTIRSRRGTVLRGYYIPGGGDGKRIAFLVHGYRSEYAETAGMYCDYYRSRGFDLFCCDQRAHGGSGGHLIGFGRFESEDCLLWIDWLLERFGPEVKIVLHGFSMGASTVMGVADRCPPNVRFLVEDSGYASALVQLRGQLGLALPPLRLLNRLIAGYDLAEADVRTALDRSRMPILFVHGQADTTVPFFNGPMLYGLYGGPKDCLFPKEARHVESMHVAPKEYQQKLDRFLMLYFSDPVPPVRRSE